MEAGRDRGRILAASRRRGGLGEQRAQDGSRRVPSSLRLGPGRARRRGRVASASSRAAASPSQRLSAARPSRAPAASNSRPAPLASGHAPPRASRATSAQPLAWHQPGQRRGGRGTFLAPCRDQRGDRHPPRLAHRRARRRPAAAARGGRAAATRESPSTTSHSPPQAVPSGPQPVPSSAIASRDVAARGEARRARRAPRRAWARWCWTRDQPAAALARPGVRRARCDG